MKKIISLLIIMSLIFITTACNKELKQLPKPETTTGLRGQLGIDKNINEETIDQYLNLPDSLYYDMRMLVDVAKYENIGGDSYLSGFIKGFEVIPIPLVVTVKGLPEEVGETYQGKTLYTLTEEGKYIANYEESLTYLEYFFPKDKVLFLMCGGGGYAGMMKNMLVNLGWNQDKIYNVGGYWYYKGNNDIKVKRLVDDKVKYDFWKVTYHDINFKQFTEIKK
ncbi:MAG: hypothetical protein GX864_02665 [Mollicutes bacterium]|nr:hypothetical protein [Mollicutes bacterium]